MRRILETSGNQRIKMSEEVKNEIKNDGGKKGEIGVGGGGGGEVISVYDPEVGQYY